MGGGMTSGRARSQRNRITLAQIRHLGDLEDQRAKLGLDGLGRQLQHLIRQIEGGDQQDTPVPISIDFSDVQATILWAAGFGKELGLDFSAYLATIPPLPTLPPEYEKYFDRTILVDTRIGITKQCQLLGVNFIGDDTTFVDFDPSKRPTQPVYWMVCQDGKRNLKKQVSTCRQEFQAFEVGSSVHEGLAIFAQDRTILNDHFMDLPGSIYRDNRECAAYLCLVNGKPCLNYRWVESKSTGYGSSSRGCVVTDEPLVVCSSL